MKEKKKAGLYTCTRPRKSNITVIKGTVVLFPAENELFT